MMRIDYIDGVRGFFALYVVYIHCNAFFYNTLSPCFFDATGAVCGFFILSGFVLSYRFWQNPNISLLTSAALRRYIRLTLPSLGSVLFAYILIKNGWIVHHEVMANTTTIDFVANYYNFVPRLRDAVWAGFWGIYFSYDQAVSYNPVLWTMEWELKGSFLSFAFLAIFGSLTRRIFLYPLFIILTIKTLYLNFLIGIMFSDLLYSKEGKKLHKLIAGKKLISWLFLFCGIFLNFYATDINSQLFNKMNFSVLQYFQIIPEWFYHTLSAAMFIFAVIQLQILQKIFSWKVLRKIGEYSFSLYLVHLPIIFSLGAIVFLKFLHSGSSLPISLFLAIVPSLMAIILATIFLHRFVDLPAGKLAKQTEKILIST